MGEVKFEGDEANEFGRPPSRSGGGLTGKLISWGVVSDRKQAEYLMIGLGVAVVIIAFFVYRSA